MDLQEVQFSEEEGTELQGEANAPEPEENNAPGYLTEERFQQMFQQLMAVERQRIAEESARAYRAKQSMVDKGAKKVEESARQQIKSIKDSGGTMTPEAEQSFVNRAVSQYMETVSDEATDSAQNQDSSANQHPQSDYIAKRLERFTKKANGLRVIETDPEGEVLMDAWKKVVKGGDPDDFLDLYESQLAKKARREGIPAQARVASIAGSGGSSAATVESYKREIMKHQGDPAKWTETKEKYRKLGVPVDTVRFTQSE